MQRQAPPTNVSARKNRSALSMATSRLGHPMALNATALISVLSRIAPGIWGPRQLNLFVQRDGSDLPHGAAGCSVVMCPDPPFQVWAIEPLTSPSRLIGTGVLRFPSGLESRRPQYISSGRRRCFPTWLLSDLVAFRPGSLGPLLPLPFAKCEDAFASKMMRIKDAPSSFRNLVAPNLFRRPDLKRGGRNGELDHDGKHTSRCCQAQFSA